MRIQTTAACFIVLPSLVVGVSCIAFGADGAITMLKNRPLEVGNFDLDWPPNGPPSMPTPADIRHTGDFSPLQTDEEKVRNSVASRSRLDVFDSESSMRTGALWDKWHKNLAEEIYVRYKGLCQQYFKHSKPLYCQVGYMVASDGRIGNVRVLVPSENTHFDHMLIALIQSIHHNPILAFPPGSKRLFVEKTGTFTWNFCSGVDLPPEPKPQIGPVPVVK